MPSWATLFAWTCVTLAAWLSQPKRLWLLALPPLAMLSRVMIHAPILLMLPVVVILGWRLRCQEPGGGVGWARILFIPSLAYVAVCFGLWLVGIPPVLSQPCTVCRSNLRNLATAVEMFAQDHKQEVPSDLAQLVPGYLLQLPQCLGGQAIQPEQRVFYRYCGLELGEGYGYRRLGKDNYMIWCRSRGYSGHQHDDHNWYDSQLGMHEHLDGWELEQGPRLRFQLEAGPPDELLGKGAKP